MKREAEAEAEAEAADLRSSASGRIGHSQQVNWSAGSKDSIQDQTDQNDQRDDNYVTKGDKLKEADHLETENKRVPFWRKLTAYRPWKSKRSSSDLKGKERYGGGGGGYDGGGGGYDGGGGGCGGGCGGGGGDDHFGYQGSWEPNPGIKRPTVSVLQTPPPPRP